MDADLITWLQDRASGPIRWGEDDCVPLCAAWIEECTGIDPIEDMRPLPYRTREERDAHAAAMDGLVRAILRWMGATPQFQRVSVPDAPQQAVGLGQLHGQWTLALRHRPGWWVTRADIGMHFMPDETIKRAWAWV